MKLEKIICDNNVVCKIKDKLLYSNFNVEPKGNIGYPLLLLCFVFAILLFIEYKHPYFFLQDDNRDSYLPYFVHNYRGLINGEIALYNFHQFLGVPSYGQTAAFYPFTYLAVFLSNLIFGHYFATIDILVILHLLIGTIGCYKFIRFFNIDWKVAFFGGMTWPLNSFIIYVSNSWNIVAAVAAYFPWMLFFSFKLYKNPSLTTSVYAITARLFLFYVGHVQYFIYSVIFEFITIILYIVSEALPGNRILEIYKYIKKYIAEYTCVLIFSLPLLLPMWHQTSISEQRSGPLPFEIFVSLYFDVSQLLRGLFYPFYQVTEHMPFVYMANLSHIGYFTLVFLIVGIVQRYIKRSKKFKIESVRLYVFIIPAILSFFWASIWIFNLCIYIIPILNRFRWPFKLAFYLDFYLIIIATLIFSHLMSKVTWEKLTKNIVISLIIGLQALNFLFLYSVASYKCFGEHAEKLPLEEKLHDKLVGGRIISIGFDKWSPTQANDHAYFTAHTLGFNYATLWGLDYFAGYDMMITPAKAKATLGLNYFAVIEQDDPTPVDYLRKAAVKWYIVPKLKSEAYEEKLNKYGISKKYEDENRVVFYDAKAYPMVFNLKGENLVNGNYIVNTNSIELTVNYRQPEQIIFNNMYDPFFEGFIDGEKTELTSINVIHFSMLVPEGNHRIIIRYRDPYLMVGIYIAAGFLFIVAIALIVRNVFKVGSNTALKTMYRKAGSIK